MRPALSTIPRERAKPAATARADRRGGLFARGRLEEGRELRTLLPDEEDPVPDGPDEGGHGGGVGHLPKPLGDALERIAALDLADTVENPEGKVLGFAGKRDGASQERARHVARPHEGGELEGDDQIRLAGSGIGEHRLEILADTQAHRGALLGVRLAARTREEAEGTAQSVHGGTLAALRDLALDVPLEGGALSAQHAHHFAALLGGVRLGGEMLGEGESLRLVLLVGGEERGEEGVQTKVAALHERCLAHRLTGRVEIDAGGEDLKRRQDVGRRGALVIQE
ncbi:MAG: hypothetical protein HC813_01725 [Planctomycetes bacterium]|nr:hypothetical protein [Planctomycetota bacterium]